MNTMDFDGKGNMVKDGGDYSVFLKSSGKVAIRMNWHYGEEKVFNSNGTVTLQRFDCFVRGASYGYYEKPAHPLYRKMIADFLAAAS